jgi:hypothetical protein
LSEIANHFDLTLQAIFYALKRLKIMTWSPKIDPAKIRGSW